MARDGATCSFVLSTDAVPVSWIDGHPNDAPKDGPALLTERNAPSLREILASPKMLAIMVLGAASGYPNQLTESALQAWLKESGVSNTRIGVMSYVALPYLLKFLWAPFIDRYPLPFLGRRRGWMLVTQ